MWLISVIKSSLALVIKWDLVTVDTLLQLKEDLYLNVGLLGVDSCTLVYFPSKLFCGFCRCCCSRSLWPTVECTLSALTKASQCSTLGNYLHYQSRTDWYSILCVLMTRTGLDYFHYHPSRALITPYAKFWGDWRADVGSFLFLRLGYVWMLVFKY